MSVDPAKVEVITRIKAQDLMENDGCTPSVKRIKSFLGIYYQYFIPNCLPISKPLFGLRAGQKRREKIENFKEFTENLPLQIGQQSVRSLSPNSILPYWRVSCLLILISMSPSFFLLMPHWTGSGQYCHKCPKGNSEPDPLLSQARPSVHHSADIQLTDSNLWLLSGVYVSHWLKGHKFTI